VRIQDERPAAGRQAEWASRAGALAEGRSPGRPDDRDPVDAAGDCELIGQIKQKVLPLFATRSVDYSSSFERHHLLVGATRLKAEVLVADESAAADSAAR
jgi:hypothetical protein